MQGLAVAIQIFQVVSMIVNLPPFEETVELKPIKAQHLTCLIVRERTSPIPLDDKRLKGLASRTRVRCKIIGKLDRYLHGKSVARQGKSLRDPFSTLEGCRVAELVSGRVDLDARGVSADLRGRL